MDLIKLFVTIFCCVTLTACYHLRVNPEPLPIKQISSHYSIDKTNRIIQRVLENELNIRIIDDESNARTLISAPRHFATDTSFGMPAGGRHYYVQYRFDLKPLADGCLVALTPHNYDLRTSYAYGLDGRVKTLYKIYPYPEYPGMFDLTLLETEMGKITNMLEIALKDIR